MKYLGIVIDEKLRWNLMYALSINNLRNNIRKFYFLAIQIATHYENFHNFYSFVQTISYAIENLGGTDNVTL